MPKSVDADDQLGDAGDLAAMPLRRRRSRAPGLGDHRGRELLELQQQPQRRVERRAGLRALVEHRALLRADLEHRVLAALAVIGPQLQREILPRARSIADRRRRCRR
jgi:hypothetical protein